ncbi:ThuA domain-containing protein [Cellulomonas sp. McL0617]|uniref:ThuA domain-containing protein n=1 Tax=Cellulomonas sp. McL0617 TaxID=3415675 RepID=UPI003CEB490F
MTPQRRKGQGVAATLPFRPRRTLTALVATVALAVTGLIGVAPAADAATTGAVQPASAVPALEHALPSVLPMHEEGVEPYKVLVFSKTAGFRHTDGIVAGIAGITALGAEHGFTVDATEDSSVFTTANLAQYATVVFLSTTSPNAAALLSAEQQQALQSYVENGGGWFGIHAAADANYDWPWYQGLVGAYFKQHPAIQQTKVLLEDRVHPATVGLGDELTLTDELYDYQTNPRDSVHVLASLDARSYTGSTMGLDHPIAWCQDYDGGRSFYLGLGHDATNWSNAGFLQMVAGGIETTAGVVPADCGASVPKNYELVKLDDNTFDPMQLDVAADGRVFYIEREGSIKVIDPTTGHTSAVATLNAFTANESGVLGLALDPNFATNNYLYVFYSPAGADSVDQLSRFTVSAATTLVEGSEKIVLKVPVQRGECCHHGGSMVFDKTSGDLYLATGDNTNPFASDGYAPLDQGAGRAAWDSERTSGNTNSLSGKLLRIHPEGDGTYTVPAGNLFAPGTDKTRPEVYGMGFRNPFRINIDPKTGTVFVADYGPDAGSADPNRGPQNTVEWNIIAKAGNYGWPYCTGPNKAYNHWNFTTHQSGPAYDCAGGPVNDSPNNTGLAQLPPAIPATLYYHYNAAEDFAEVGGGGAPMAGPMYRYDETSTSDTKWPAYWDGKALFGEWNNNVVYSLLTTSDVRRLQKVTKISEASLGAGQRSVKMMDAKFGPDGSLYVIDWGSGWENNGDSGIYRIDYVYGNRSPIAKASADVDSGPAPLAVQLSSAGSKDPDGDALTYSWDFGDGTTSTEASPSHSFAAGTYNVVLTATDPDGRSGLSSVSVVSGNTRPTVTVTSPVDGGFFQFGDQINFDVTVTDPEDGSTTSHTISCDDVHVQNLLGHVSGSDSHAHPMSQTTGCTGVVQTLEDGGHGGDVHLFWVVEASYTDKGAAGGVPSLTGTTSVVLQDKHHQAEHYDSTGRLPGSASTGDPGVQKETTSDPAGGTQNIGFIEPDDWFAFARVNLSGIDRIQVRAASPADGGADFNIRWNDPVGGPLLGTVHVDNTGGWQTFQNVGVDLANRPTGTGTIYFVAAKPGTTGSVANVNWVDFIGKGVTANERPVITAADLTPTTGTVPVSVAATASASDPDGKAVSYHWDFGTTDGATADTAAASYTYTVPGKYTAKLTVTDPGGATASRTFPVTVDAPPEGCFGNLSDQFDGTTLNTGRWTTVVRPNQDLQVRDGALHIPASKTDLYGAGGDVTNIVLQDLPKGAWQATTKVNVKAYTAYQQAGLLLYTNDENYVKLVVQGRSSNPAEHIIQFAHEVGGSAQEANSAALGTAFPDTVYLRITSDGTTLSPSYSTDGTTWISPDQSWSGWDAIRKDQASLGSPKIGLAAFANASGTVTDAAFDWFRLSPDPTEAVSTPDDEFTGDALVTCRWTTLRPDATALRVGGGKLSIDTLPGEIDTSNNVIVQNQPAGNHWVVETKVDGSALNEHYQQAGIVVLGDDRNYVKLDFITDNDPGAAVARRLEFRSVIDNVQQQPQPNLNNLTQGVWYLRVERQDNNFAGWYSTDGVAWTKFADTVANIPAASGGKVGLFALGVNQTGSATAVFDYFHVVGGAPADTTAPITTATKDPAQPNGANGWYTGPVTVSLTAVDESGGSGIDAISAAVDGGSPATYTAPVALTGDGVHTVAYAATDKAGNAEGSRTLSAKIDATAPVTTATVSDTGLLTLTSVDATSGVDRTEYRVGTQTWSAYTAPVQLALTSAEQTAELRSVDEAGNTEATQSVTVPAAGDTTAPVSKATVDPSSPDGQNGWYTGDVSVTLTSTDADSGVAGIEYALTDDAWAAYTAPLTIADGITAITFRATDEAGNVESVKTLTLKRDSVAPETAADLDADSTDVTVTLVRSDDTSGVASTQYRVDAGAWKTYSAPFVVARTSAAQVVEFRSTDKAGNVAGPRSVTVPATQVQLKPSVTSMSLSASRITVGSPVKVTISVVTAGTLGAELVTLYDGSVPIGAGILRKGTVTVTVPDLEAGTHALQAKFAGNATVAESASPVRQVVVDAAASTTKLTASASQQSFGTDEPVLLTAKVTLTSGGVPAGTVEFRSGSQVIYSAPVSSGKATYRLRSDATVGATALTATFVPSDPTASTGSTSAAVTVTVVKAVSATTLKASASSQRYGTNKPVKLTATVSVDTGRTAGTVVFASNGTTVGTVAVSDGKAVYTLSAATSVGSAKLTATFVPAAPAGVAGSTSTEVTVVVKS